MIAKYKLFSSRGSSISNNFTLVMRCLCYVFTAKWLGPGLLPLPSLVGFLTMTELSCKFEYTMIMITQHKKSLEDTLVFLIFARNLLVQLFFLSFMHMFPMSKIKYSYGCPARFYRQQYHKICFQEYTRKFNLLGIFYSRFKVYLKKFSYSLEHFILEVLFSYWKI